MKMMKIICFVFLIVVIVEKSYAGPEEMAKIITDCKTAEKVSDADVMNFKNKVKPASKEVKCLTTCVMEKMGLISNNQLNKDGCLKVAKMMPNSNEKTMQSVTEVVEDCKVVQEKDRCEYGAKVTECLMEAGAKRQLPNIFFM